MSDRLQPLRNVGPGTARLPGVPARRRRATPLLGPGTSNGYSTVWLADRRGGAADRQARHGNGGRRPRPLANRCKPPDPRSARAPKDGDPRRPSLRVLGRPVLAFLAADVVLGLATRASGHLYFRCLT